jgi:hypothetical protein
MEPNQDAITVDRYASRPPILVATSLLGLSDADVAHRLDVSGVTVAHWASGKRQIPKFRHVMLRFIVQGLLFDWMCELDRTRGEVIQRRRKLVQEAVLAAFRLSKEELGPVDPLLLEAAHAFTSLDPTAQAEFNERVRGLRPGQIMALIEQLKAQDDDAEEQA